MTAVLDPIPAPRPLETGRLLGAGARDLGEHVARHGVLPALPAEQVLELATAAGLTGRGGAAFPAGRKLATVAAGRDAVVVANGAEGEPASSKDRWLLTHAPHLVLDGLALAARAVHARRTILYGPADLLDATVATAVRQRRDDPPVRTVAAPDGFVTGQESAVVALVNRGVARPTGGPPVFVRGVDGRPTLVHNVETLAHLALIVRHGAAWFRSAGTPDEPGTRLLTVSGAVHRPGVYELAAGRPLRETLAAAGGASEPVQALLVGGYHGGWVPWSPQAAMLPVTRNALAPYDAAPGAGVIIALPGRACGVRAGADIAAYLAGQSARQCGPCRNGLPTLAQHLDALARGRASRGVIDELHRVTALVAGRGACAHPDGTARLVRSTLRSFAADLDAHTRGRCLAAGRIGGSR